MTVLRRIHCAHGIKQAPEYCPAGRIGAGREVGKLESGKIRVGVAAKAAGQTDLKQPGDRSRGGVTANVVDWKQQSAVVQVSGGMGAEGESKR